MNYLIAEANLSDRIVCDSAGTSGYHIGAPPDPRMQAAARQRGIAMRGQSRPFQASDLETFDLILAMDRDNYWDILTHDPHRQYRDKVRMMCEFATQHRDESVPDPYYGGSQGFERVLDLLQDACQGLLDDLHQRELI